MVLAAQLLDRAPGADQQQGVAGLQGRRGARLGIEHGPTATQPDRGQPTPELHAGRIEGLAKEPRVGRQHDLGHADGLGTVGEVEPGQRQRVQTELGAQGPGLTDRRCAVEQQHVARH